MVCHLSRGILTEGVLAGKDMLDYIDIAKSAPERHPDTRHPGFCTVIARRQHDSSNTSRLVLQRSCDHRRVSRLERNVDSTPRPEQTLLFMGAAPSDSRRRARRSDEGNSQTDRCDSRVHYTSFVHPHLATLVTQNG